jgi:hypothetical protein
MRGVTKSWLFRVVVVVAGTLAPLPFRASGVQASAPVPLVIVVAPNSSVANLSFYELKHLYMGDYVNGSDGKRLIPLNRMPQTPERLAFDASVLGMNADQAAAYWIDRRIRGQSGSPRAVQSADLAQRVVTHLEGAVAYVRADELRPGVKVVRVDGKLPTEAAYNVR